MRSPRKEVHIWIRAESHLRLDVVQRLHILVRQFPVENVEVLLDAVRVGRLGQNGRASLNAPSQNHLARALLVLLRNLDTLGTVETLDKLWRLLITYPERFEHKYGPGFRMRHVRMQQSTLD